MALLLLRAQGRESDLATLNPEAALFLDPESISLLRTVLEQGGLYSDCLELLRYRIPEVSSCFVEFHRDERDELLLRTKELIFNQMRNSTAAFSSGHLLVPWDDF